MKILTAHEVAERLRVSENWVKEHTRSRCPADQRLPYLKLGKHLRFSDVAIEAYLEKLAGETRMKIVRKSDKKATR